MTQEENHTSSIYGKVNTVLKYGHIGGEMLEIFWEFKNYQFL